MVLDQFPHLFMFQLLHERIRYSSKLLGEVTKAVRSEILHNILELVEWYQLRFEMGQVHLKLNPTLPHTIFYFHEFREQMI